MDFYFWLTTGIVVAAVMIVLFQLFLSARRSFIPGLLLPLFCLYGWLFFVLEPLDLSEFLNESAIQLCADVFLYTLLVTAMVFAGLRLLKWYYKKQRKLLRAKRLEEKEQLRQQEEENFGASF